jgi:hypothetical protein
MPTSRAGWRDQGQPGAGSGARWREEARGGGRRHPGPAGCGPGETEPDRAVGGGDGGLAAEGGVGAGRVRAAAPVCGGTQWREAVTVDGGRRRAAEYTAALRNWRLATCGAGASASPEWRQHTEEAAGAWAAVACGGGRPAVAGGGARTRSAAVHGGRRRQRTKEAAGGAWRIGAAARDV